MKKITRNSLKELIRQSIKELDFKDKEAFDKYDKKHKMRASTKVNIGGKETTVGQAIDVGGPSHPNVPTKKKGGDKGVPTAALSKYAKSEDYENTEQLVQFGNPTELSHLLNHLDDNGLSDDAFEEINQKIDNIENFNYDKFPDIQTANQAVDAIRAVIAAKILDPKSYGGKNESVTESVKRRRFTVKEVQKWMKTLEENRYKKVYNSDCRRVSWMANNMNEDVANMPISMRKKWTKAQYGRERYLAKEFLKSKMGEQKLRESIKKIVTGLITEATTYKGVFDYNPKDPHKAGRSFEEMFDGAEYGYSESWDTYGWNDQNNHDKAVEEYHKEMFKIVDGYVAANKKAQSFWKTKDKIFKKWRKTDGSKSGD